MMKKHLFGLLILFCVAIPSFAQRMPVATTMDANGKMLYVDFRESELTTPDPQHNSIQKAVILDFQCVPTPTNPPAGNDRFYCDSGTGQMSCLTSTGASCVGAGTGSVSSVGLAGPTGIPISNSPCTSNCTLTWAMPSGWVLGDVIVGNGSNSVARLAAPTTPDQVPEMFISTPNSGATQPAWALAGLPGRVVSTTTDTIVAADRTPQTIEYTNNNPTAITVPDPASSGFNGNPAFITIAEGLGPYTFTPQTSAVITYCDGSNCFAGQPNIVLQKGEYASWSSPTTSNWLVRKGSTQPIANPPVVNGLISGGGVTWTGLLTFTCSAAQYAIAGTVYNSPQTNLTLAAADPSNPRIDVIAVNSSGACVAITGTPAGSPAAPSVDPTSQLSLTFVTIAANATTPTLNSILVYDENSTPPTEYTCTPTSNFNCNSTNNPFHLTHDIEATTAVATNSVTLINSGTVNFSTYSTLSFNIRNKASWPAAKSLQICFLNSTTIVGNCIAFKNGVFGFNQANITGYQQIVIPLSQFALGTTVADRIRFQVIGGGGSIGFYLDWIQIQSTLSGSGSSSFQLQVNGQNTQPTTNLADNASVTWACTVAPGTTVSTCKATAVGAPPSGTAGGDLSGTYPNPTVNQVEGAAIPTSAHVIGTNGSKQLVASTQTDINALGYVAGGGTANAQTATLSPAITSLTNGLQVCWLPSNANASTTPTLAVNGLTAKTIVKAGGAALAASDLTTTAIACAIYDGTNFELQNPQTTTAAGITSINTSATGPAVTIAGSGSTNVSTSGNTITIAGVNGPPSPTVNTISTSTYTINNSDNSWRDKFTNAGAVAVTLPQANTIGVSPFIGQKLQQQSLACNPTCTTSTFSQSSSHILVIQIGFQSSTATISSVTSGNGDTVTNLATDQTGGSAGAGADANSGYYWVATTTASGSNSISITMSANTTINVGVVEYNIVSLDKASANKSNGAVSVTNSVSFSNEVAILAAGNSLCPSGWTQRAGEEPGIVPFVICDKLLSSVASVSASITGTGAQSTLQLANFQISGTPVFTAGWYVVLENATGNLVTVTPTTSTINGQTTLVIATNEYCAVMSDGTNYNAICGFIPNLVTNGVMGSPVEIAGVNSSSLNADVGTTTLITTGAVNAFYTVDADVNCDSAVSTGVATLTITFTDTSSTVQTYTATAACTTLGSSSIGSIRQAFRAKASTAIQYGVAHTGTQPTYDVSVAVNQLATK